MRVCSRFVVVCSASILLTNNWALSQISLPGFGQKSASSNDQKANKLLHEKLPLVLDANTAYPTVLNEDLLGGRFNGRVLPLTVDTLTKPLAPGDYVIPMTFFCSEYSVHRGGNGIAYELGPAQGTAARAISTLLWRGMLTGHKPQELQSVSWAIQGSVAYDKMPPKYRALVDQLIPDMKNEVNGQAFADIEDGFQGKVNRTTKKLSDAIGRGTGGFVHADIKVDVELNESFQRLGQIGHSALDGEKLNTLFTTAFASDADREQALYAGQGQQSRALPAANGPWSVKVPGVAYMRFIVHGGNLQSDNVMQIRILPPRTSQAQADGGPHLVLSSFQKTSQSTSTNPSVLSLFNGSLNEAALSQCRATPVNQQMCMAQAITVNGNTAYCIGAGAQAPIMAPSSPIPTAPPGSTPNAGQIKIIFNGTDTTSSLQTVVVGQPIDLVASPGSGPISGSVHWTVAGNKVGKYVHSAQGAETTPPDLTTASLHFYWTTYSEDKPLAVTATIDGQTASAEFTVTGPQVSVSRSTNDVTIQKQVGKPDKSDGWWAEPGVVGSNWSPGFELAPTQLLGGPSGDISWYQFIVSDSDTGKTCVPDGALPYGKLLLPDNKATSRLSAHIYNPDALRDSPGQLLGPLALKKSDILDSRGKTSDRTLRLESILMWTSRIPNSIPVSLGYVDWQYEASAVNMGKDNGRDGWVLTRASISYSDWTPDLNLPQWKVTQTRSERDKDGRIHDNVPFLGVCPKQLGY
jgi:hypothetical protein